MESERSSLTEEQLSDIHFKLKIREKKKIEKVKISKENSSNPEEIIRLKRKIPV